MDSWQKFGRYFLRLFAWCWHRNSKSVSSVVTGYHWLSWWSEIISVTQYHLSSLAVIHGHSLSLESQVITDNHQWSPQIRENSPEFLAICPVCLFILQLLCYHWALRCFLYPRTPFSPPSVPPPLKSLDHVWLIIALEIFTMHLMLILICV